MGRERELKFTLLADPPDLEGLDELGGHRMRFARLEDQSNIYLDTPDRKLSANGQALRLRHADGRAVVTLKGRGNVNGGAFDRPELEADLPGLQAGLDDLPPGELRDQLDHLIGLEPLEVIARLRTERRVWAVEGVGELSIDSVRVLPNDARTGDDSLAEFEELELEAKSPRGADLLPDLALVLRGLAAMVPPSTGKLGRALAAAKPALSPADAWQDLAASTLETELQRLLAFLPVVQADHTIEGVHGMRVSTRRLRAALSFFRDAFDNSARMAANTALRDLGRTLGAVRDLDVLSQRVAKKLDDASLARAPLARERSSARELLGEALAGRRFTDLIAALRDLLPGSPDHAQVKKLSITKATPGALRRAFRRANRQARRVKRHGTVEQAHELRKAGKRLRYGLEFLNTVFDTSETVAALKDLQVTLGRLNDAANAAKTLGELAARVEEVAAGEARRLAEEYGGEARAALAELPALLADLHWRRMERALRAALAANR